jgi:hypothetical protein
MVIVDEIVKQNYCANAWVIQKYLNHSLIKEMVPKYFLKLSNAQHRHEVLSNVQIVVI